MLRGLCLSEIRQSAQRPTNRKTSSSDERSVILVQCRARRSRRLAKMPRRERPSGSQLCLAERPRHRRPYRARRTTSSRLSKCVSYHSSVLSTVASAHRRESEKPVFELNVEAGIDRKQTVIWNVVPCYLGDGTRFVRQRFETLAPAYHIY